MSSAFRSRSLLLAAVLCLTGAAAQACGDDDNAAATDAGVSTTVPEASAPAAIATPTQATQQVGTSGGKVLTTTGTGVEIPANAVTGSVNITVAQSATAGPNGAIGATFQLGPAGLQFSTPATVVMTLDPQSIPIGKTAADIVIFTAPDGTTDFSPLATSVRDATHVTAQTTHFSLFVPVVAGVVIDSGVLVDSGTPTGANDGDAGASDASVTASDASVTKDASTVTDAGGGASDAGTTSDGGSGASDASTETDGGSGASDAGK